MAGIGTIVSIRRSDEYGGKYAGKLGIVKKLADNRVGVEFSDLKTLRAAMDSSGSRKKM